MTALRRLLTSVAILAAGFLPHAIPSAQAAEIQVLYNSTEIVDGDSTPSSADRTFFGLQAVGAGNLAYTFTIKNTSTTAGDNLILAGTPRAVIGGANPGDFLVTRQPAASVAPGGSTIFVVTWTPSVGGDHNATLSIANNDNDENPYDFAIQATALLKLIYTAGPCNITPGFLPTFSNSGCSRQITRNGACASSAQIGPTAPRKITSTPRCAKATASSTATRLAPPCTWQ